MEDERPHNHQVPPGISLLRLVRGKDMRRRSYRNLVLLVTFIAYACYHQSRKPPSIVKSVLDPETTGALHPRTLRSPRDVAPYSWPLNLIYIRQEYSSNHELLKAGWAPFNGTQGKARLGEIDVAFLACYAFGMYFAGHLGDRVDLRVFLTLGMVLSGFFVCLFGMAYWWQIHNIYYFFAVQMMAGLFQATGWPSVVAIVGNWYGKSKRGLIMGIWNAHTSVGNIVGSLVAAAALQYGWGWSFIFPGLIIMFGGLLVYCLLIVEPEDVGLPSPYERRNVSDTESECSLVIGENHLPAQNENPETESSPEASPRDEECSQSGKVIVNFGKRVLDEESGLSSEQLCATPRRNHAVGFLEAWLIPGVAPFAFCLFFSKLVAYTFLYWLPFYVRHTEIAGEYLSDATAGNLSTLFDIGGVVGGILAGYISDKLNARATTAATFMYIAIPVLYLYHQYGHVSMTLNVALMVLAGLFVNGPYALITTAVSADLGTHGSLNGDSKALATVTAIIDGTGSVGAALGPLLTGFISQNGWSNVFIMLMLSAFIAGLLISRLVVAEIMEKINSIRSPQKDTLEHGNATGSLNEPLISHSG